MKLKNKQIVGAEDALSKISNTNLPIKQAYKISKTVLSVKNQSDFINEQRNNLIKKYGKKDKDGYSIPTNDEKALNKFIKDFNDILDLEEEIDVRTLSIDDLERVELTANELESIVFIIEDVE